MKKLLTLLLLSIHTEAYYEFDFEQIEEDSKKIKATEFRMNFNIENPKHKYFLTMNILDAASTVYAMKNRNSLVEANFLLPEKPEFEEILLQKAVAIYLLNYMGLFSEQPEDQWYINSANILITGVVVNNLYQIEKND